MTKSDVKDEINKTIDTNAFAERIGKIISDKLKGDKEFEDKVVKIASNVLTQYNKTLWTKRGFWQSQLKNTST